MIKDKVISYIKENRMIEKGDVIVAGVSGGADSMCLLNILAALKDEMQLKLVVVHLNHGIRFTAARDAAFVEAVAGKLGLKYYIYEEDVPGLAKSWGVSEEQAGRRRRYELFEQALREQSDSGEGKIAVAHNVNDNVETILHNLFRGTGIKGMSGIQPVRGNIIRPVLCLTREEIEQYNEKNGIEYVTDETNFETEYTRNKLRLKVVPLIEQEINEKASEHINMAGKSLSEINDYIECEGQKIYEAIATVNESENYIYLPSDEYEKLHGAMKTQVTKQCIYAVAHKAKDITRAHIESAQKLFYMPVGKSVNLPYGITAVKEYDGVSFRRNVSKESTSDDDAFKEESEQININKEGDYSLKLNKELVSLTVERDVLANVRFEENKYTKWIDCDIIENGLQFRTRRTGDYIIVDEKGSKKKLKDYFIDRKIPKEKRDSIGLVTRGNEVVWILGYRLSAAYKVSSNSKNILKLCVNGCIGDMMQEENV